MVRSERTPVGTNASVNSYRKSPQHLAFQTWHSRLGIPVNAEIVTEDKPDANPRLRQPNSTKRQRDLHGYAGSCQPRLREPSLESTDTRAKRRPGCTGAMARSRFRFRTWRRASTTCSHKLPVITSPKRCRSTSTSEAAVRDRPLRSCLAHDPLEERNVAKNSRRIGGLRTFSSRSRGLRPCVVAGNLPCSA